MALRESLRLFQVLKGTTRETADAPPLCQSPIRPETRREADKRVIANL